MPIYKDGKKDKKGNIYYYVVSYTTTDGKHKQKKSKRYKTRKEAEKEEAKFLLSIGKLGDTNITFDYLINDYLKDKAKTLKPQSLIKASKCCDHVRAVLGDISVVKMRRQEYERFRDYLDDNGFSATYKNKLNVQLKTLLKYASKRFDITNNIPFTYEPFKDNAPAVKEMEFYTLEEFNAFIACADDIRYKSLFTTLFFQGLRLGEANFLTWRQIDFNRKTLSVVGTLTTKVRDKAGNYLTTTPKPKTSIRTLPLTNAVIEALKALYEYYSKFEDFSVDWHVFGGLSALPESSIQKANERYSKRAGVKKIRVHDMRHSCASLLINNGANIVLVAKFLGHSNVEQTLNTYAHFYKSRLDEIVDALNKL